MEFECPVCGTTDDVDHLPDNACDDVEYECPGCKSVFVLGWVAEIEIRKTITKRGEARGYVCHNCLKPVAAPAPGSLIVWCAGCCVHTAATISQDLANKTFEGD